MTIENIISSVRLCIDEKKGSSTEAFVTEDYTDMDDIIKDKIGDAIRWLCLYGPAEMLGGSDETDTPVDITPGVMKDWTPSSVTAIAEGGGRVVLPSDYIKLARVRVSGWSRAIKVPISEDSDEYLQLYDTSGAAATADRPQAAIIDKAAKELEVWPWSNGNTIYITYVFDTEGEVYEVTSGNDTIQKVSIPPKTKTAFIYYIAFLLLSAYGDERATRMLEIAKMNIGKS